VDIRRFGLLREVWNFHYLHPSVGKQFIALAICDEEAWLTPRYNYPRNSRLKDELGAGTRPRFSLRARFQRAVNCGRLQAEIGPWQFRQR
jgi:hypothetical protein